MCAVYNNVLEVHYELPGVIHVHECSNLRIFCNGDDFVTEVLSAQKCLLYDNLMLVSFSDPTFNIYCK